MANYLIIGGHGKVALRLAPLLTQDGHTVTSMIRKQDQVDEVEKTGAQALVMDVQSADQDVLAGAFQGQDAVIWTAGAGGGDPERTYAVDRDAAIRTMDAAEQAGVKRYVMVSYLGAGLDHGVPEDDAFFPYAQSKAEADEHLRSSGLDWTILGPGMLTEEAPTGTITVGEAAHSAENQDTSRTNVAEVARVALSTPETVGRKIDFVDGSTPVPEALKQG